MVKEKKKIIVVPSSGSMRLERRHSLELEKRLKEYINVTGGSYCEDELFKGIIKTYFKLNNGLAIEQIIEIRDSDYVGRHILSCYIAPEYEKAVLHMATLLNIVNTQLDYGNFEIDMRKGNIAFRNYYKPETNVTDEGLEEFLCKPLNIIDTYAEAIMNSIKEENKMTKTEKIKKLIEENREILLAGEKDNGICFDGIIDEESFEEQKIKIAVVMKETNGNNEDGEKPDKYSDWDYIYWLKHQQADNEPEIKKDKNGKEYEERNVFYGHTFRKLCHWLSMFTDIIESGDTTPEKFLVNDSVDVEKVRTVLKKVAVINVKKSWGSEMTNSHDLWEYAMDRDRMNVFKEQLEIINPDVVLCCSGDVYEIMREYICKDGGEIFGYSDSTKENSQYYECFTAGKRKFIKFYHPAYYGKNEKYLAELARDVFKWALKR